MLFHIQQMATDEFSYLCVLSGGQSRQSYLLESVPARRRRLSQQDTSGGKKRGNTGHGRANKSSGSPKTQLRAEVCGRSKKIPVSNKEKENEVVKKKEDALVTSDGKSIMLPPPSMKVEEIKKDLIVSETKPKRKLENGREVKVRIKKAKTATGPPVPVGDINDSNNNSSEVKPVVGVSIFVEICQRFCPIHILYNTEN